MVPATNRYAQTTPGGQRFTYEDFERGRVNLAGCDRVIVISHGAPGSIGWGPDRPILGARGINGQELGQKLKNAGFQGQGASVEVLSCNGGTEPLFGGQSVIEGVHQATGATAHGARANNRLLGALSLGGTTRTGQVSRSNTTPVEWIDRGSMARVGPPAGGSTLWGHHEDYRSNLKKGARTPLYREP